MKIMPKVYSKVVFMTCGESYSDQHNLISGWQDVKLTSKGRKSAINAGKNFKQGNYKFDIVFTSIVRRADETLHLILKEMGLKRIPTCRSWKLNPRHSGAFTGIRRSMTMLGQFSSQVVDGWEESFDYSPPMLLPSHCLFKSMQNFSYRVGGPSCEEFPLCESMRFTYLRVIEFWKERIMMNVAEGQNILIITHMDVMRSLVKLIQGLPDDICMSVHIPEAVPIALEFDSSLNMMHNASLQFINAVSVLLHPSQMKQREQESEPVEIPAVIEPVEDDKPSTRSIQRIPSVLLRGDTAKMPAISPIKSTNLLEIVECL